MPFIPVYSRRDSNVETSICSRDNVVHQSVVLEDDEAAALAKLGCVGRENGLAVDPVLL